MLLWLLEGAFKWYDSKTSDPSYKIPVPDKVKYFTKEQKDEIDSVGAFVLETVEGKTPVKELYPIYELWCSSSSFKPLSISKFRAAMIENKLGPVQKRVEGKNMRYYPVTFNGS